MQKTISNWPNLWSVDLGKKGLDIRMVNASSLLSLRQTNEEKKNRVFKRLKKKSDK